MKDIYEAEYIGKLKVEKIGKGFAIKLGLNIPEHPLTIYTELEGDDLIKFIKQELYNRHLISNDYYHIQRVYKVPCQPINKKCRDERCVNREN